MPSIQIALPPRRIGEYLSCDSADIEWALSVQTAELASGNIKHIGEILLEREQISQEQLINALHAQRMDRLRQCSLFAGLSHDELAGISETAEEIRLAPGETLFRQDQRGDSLYVLVSGRVMISRYHELQEIVPIGVALPGDVLGERECITGGSRPFSAYAVEPALLLRIRYDSLLEHGGCLRDSIERSTQGLGAEPQPDEISDSLGPRARAESGAGVDALIEHVVRRASQVLQADRAYIFLVDPESGDLFTRIENQGEKREILVSAGTGIAGWVAQTGEIVNLSEAYLDPRFNPEIDVWSGYWTRTLLAGPVRNLRDEVVAVIQVVNKREGQFDQEDEVLFRALAHQSASALKNW